MAGNQNKKADEADDTRARLLDAAGSVFAEAGFQTTTVRDICARAGANVAAVNYHFGDKLKLYNEVLRYCMCIDAGDEVSAFMESAAAPKDKLRFVIGRMMRHMIDARRPAWATRIILHEMTQPTAGLAEVVDEMIRPKYDQLRRLIGGIIGRNPADRVTHLCAHSIVGQIRHYATGRGVIGRLWTDADLTPSFLDEVADHIAAFSMAGLAAISENEETMKHSGAPPRGKGREKSS